MPNNEDEWIERLLQTLYHPYNEANGYILPRADAKASIQAKLLEARLESVELLRWKYKELNDQSVSNEFLEAYNIITEELQSQLQASAPTKKEELS